MTKVGVIRAGGRGWKSRSKMKADILIDCKNSKVDDEVLIQYKT